MIYLRSLLRYTFTIIKTFFFIFAVMLIYFFAEVLFYKSVSAPSFFFDALKNFGGVMLRLFPFIIILASLLYFSKISLVSGKPFIITMLPVVTILNTVLILLSFSISADFHRYEPETNIYYYPELSIDSINSIGDFKIALTGNASRGILFYNNTYIFNDLKILKDEISINTSLVIGNSSILPSYNNFIIPYKTQAIKLRSTGITDSILNYILDLGIDLQNAFLSTAGGASLAALIISFLFIYLGFFTLGCGLSVFFSDRQTVLLTWSSLFILALVLFAVMPQFFALVSIIRAGIKNDQFRLLLPGILVGLLGGLLGYALISIKTANLPKGNTSEK